MLRDDIAALPATMKLSKNVPAEGPCGVIPSDFIVRRAGAGSTGWGLEVAEDAMVIFLGVCERPRGCRNSVESWRRFKRNQLGNRSDARYSGGSAKNTKRRRYI